VSEAVKIRFLTSGPDKNRIKGDVFSVSEEQAGELIKGKHAEPVERAHIKAAKAAKQK